jgi:hypothetical protein
MKLPKFGRRSINIEHMEYCPTGAMNWVPLLGELACDFLSFEGWGIRQQGRRLSGLLLGTGTRTEKVSSVCIFVYSFLAGSGLTFGKSFAFHSVRFAAPVVMAKD